MMTRRTTAWRNSEGDQDVEEVEDHGRYAIERLKEDV